MYLTMPSNPEIRMLIDLKHELLRAINRYAEKSFYFFTNRERAFIIERNPGSYGVQLSYAAIACMTFELDMDDRGIMGTIYGSCTPYIIPLDDDMLVMEFSMAVEFDKDFNMLPGRESGVNSSEEALDDEKDIADGVISDELDIRGLIAVVESLPYSYEETPFPGRPY